MKCPNCGKELHILHERYEKNFHEYKIEKFTGSCFDCNKIFTWADVYEFTYTTPLRENDENDHS